MFGNEIYLDNNATTRPLKQVRDAMIDVLDTNFGNPSSAHLRGEISRNLITESREELAIFLNTEPHNIIFTSSGTEANNTIVQSFVHGKKPGRIVTTNVEHSSIKNMCEFLSEEEAAEVIFVPATRDGIVDTDLLFENLTPKTRLVSVQWVNNETGVINPIHEISARCKQLGIPLHSDAAQGIGKIPIDLAQIPVDYLSLTAHKFHGPQGIGAIIKNENSYLKSMFYGGSQESKLRAGTENVPGIVGMGVAVRERKKRFDEINNKILDLRDTFEQIILKKIPDAKINGGTVARVSNTSNVLFKHVDGEALMLRLDQEGIRCSQSSACTNMLPEPSYVLRAMGLSVEEAYSSVRFSFSEENTKEETIRAANHIISLYKKLYRGK